MRAAVKGHCWIVGTVYCPPYILFYLPFVLQLPLSYVEVPPESASSQLQGSPPAVLFLNIWFPVRGICDSTSSSCLLLDTFGMWQILCGGLPGLDVKLSPNCSQLFVLMWLQWWHCISKSQFIASYRAEHWTAIKHILKYLKVSCDNGITFTWDASLNLEIFIDSDYANRTDALSINSYVAILGGGSVTWSLKKQQMITLSTTEAEYMALTKGAKQLIWLQHFI